MFEKMRTNVKMVNFEFSVKNEGWFEECEDTKSIARLWKEFKPSLPGKIYKGFLS